MNVCFIDICLIFVGAGIECAIEEGNVGLIKQSIGRMDKVSAVRQVHEKYLAHGKDVFWTFVDLERRMIRLIDIVRGRC